MYRITKRFEFSASHELKGLDSGHPCSRLHGHNYIVEIELTSEVLDETGFVLDYGKLRDFGRFIDEMFDHRHLNDVMDYQSSAENIAKLLFDWAKERWPQVSAVRVSETPKTWAEYVQS